MSTIIISIPVHVVSRTYLLLFDLMINQLYLIFENFNLTGDNIFDPWAGRGSVLIHYSFVAYHTIQPIAPFLRHRMARRNRSAVNKLCSYNTTFLHAIPNNRF